MAAVTAVTAVTAAVTAVTGTSRIGRLPKNLWSARGLESFGGVFQPRTPPVSKPIPVTGFGDTDLVI
jgi:hypothetical protein